MKRNIVKLTLILLISIIDSLLIAGQIWITAANFRWFPWYQSENLFAMLLLLNPIILVIVIALLFVNNAIKETRFNGKMLYLSIIVYAIFILSFDYIVGRFQSTPYFSTIFNSVLTASIVIYVTLMILILVNTIITFLKVVKGNCYTT